MVKVISDTGCCGVPGQGEVCIPAVAYEKLKAKLPLEVLKRIPVGEKCDQQTPTPQEPA